MKKINYYHLLFSLLTLFIIIAMFPQTASASYFDDDDKTAIEKTLRLNKATKIKADTKTTNYFYSFDLPADGCIYVPGNKISASYCIYSPERSNEINNDSYYKPFGQYLYYNYSSKYGASGGDQYFFLPKGTYYIRFFDADNKSITVSYYKSGSFNKKNYCGARAKYLPRGKKDTLIIEKKYEYNRWYKVFLDKKKPITVTISNDKSFEFSVFDSNYKEVKCPIYSGSSYKTDILPPGKYYIKVRRHEYGSRVCTISWK